MNRFLSSSFNNSRFYDHGLGCSLSSLSVSRDRWQSCLLRDSLYVLLWGGLLHSITSDPPHPPCQQPHCWPTYSITPFGSHKTNSPNWSIIASTYMCYVQLCRSLNAKEPSVSQCQLLYWRPVSGGYVWYLLTIPTISHSFYAHFMHIFMQTKILTIEG